MDQLSGTLNIDLVDFARQGAVIVMAGAGVSAGNPSALPGWKPMNAAIAKTLCQRLESSIDSPDWLSHLIPVIDVEREAERFPPDYQAQLIEEMCGHRYFRALQSLDVDVINAAHDGIAALAAAGALKAVVTTNFDRLIEQALDRRGVKYDVAYDDVGYVDMSKRLSTGGSGPLPVIKIHGCVSDHWTMIDTLKQRKKGVHSTFETVWTRCKRATGFIWASRRPTWRPIRNTLDSSRVQRAAPARPTFRIPAIPDSARAHKFSWTLTAIEAIKRLHMPPLSCRKCAGRAEPRNRIRLRTTLLWAWCNFKGNSGHGRKSYRQPPPACA